MKVLLDSRPSFHHCPALVNGFDTNLIPWPGLKFACVKVLQLYGKVFDQTELCELVIRYVAVPKGHLYEYDKILDSQSVIRMGDWGIRVENFSFLVPFIYEYNTKVPNVPRIYRT